MFIDETIVGLIIDVILIIALIRINKTYKIILELKEKLSELENKINKE